MEPIPKKSLGQHWLHDEATLQAICNTAELTPDDTVLEIGPGLGTLTKLLVTQAKQIVAVEFDAQLAHELPGRLTAANLEIVQQDILSFDFTSLPPDYKIVANIPYYLTSNLIRVISETSNRPSVAVLLVQKEVAERVVAQPGQLSILGVTAQYYWDTGLGQVVPGDLFTPPPKIDSQVLILQRPTAERFPNVDTKQFFRLIKAGFAERRKKLRSSLSSGLHRSKLEVEQLLRTAGIDPDLRAQALSLDDWYKLYQVLQDT